MIDYLDDVVITISLGISYGAKGACEAGRDGVGILWRLKEVKGLK